MLQSFEEARQNNSLHCLITFGEEIFYHLE